MNFSQCSANGLNMCIWFVFQLREHKVGVSYFTGIITGYEKTAVSSIPVQIEASVLNVQEFLA